MLATNSARFTRPFYDVCDAHFHMNLVSPPFRLFVYGDERRLGDKNKRGRHKMKIFDHCPAFSRLAAHGWPWMVAIIAAPMGVMYAVRAYYMTQHGMDSLTATVRGGLFAVGVVNVLLLLFLLVASDFLYRLTELRKTSRKEKSE